MFCSEEHSYFHHINMTSFENSVQKAVNQSIKKTINGYVKEFSTKLTVSLNSGKKKNWDKESLIGLWNKITTNMSIDPQKKKVKDADPSVPQCEHIYGKGIKKTKRCVDKVSDKSSTKSFCSRHYKQNENVKEEKPKNKDEKYCCYILTKGKNKDDECGIKVAIKCKDGKFCSKHLNSENKEKPLKKQSDGKIHAYRITGGNLKGFYAFEKDGKKYVIDSETKEVKGYEENGELVDLDKEGIQVVMNIHPFKLDKKYSGVETKFKKEDDENEEEDDENEEEDDENEEEDDENEEEDEK